MRSIDVDLRQPQNAVLPDARRPCARRSRRAASRSRRTAAERWLAALRLASAKSSPSARRPTRHSDALRSRPARARRHADAPGVLLHPTSLPGRYGIGDLGDELLAFLDWAASAGMRIWQVLPLNPPGYGNSPYGCLSSFAGNPLLISPRASAAGRISSRRATLETCRHSRRSRRLRARHGVQERAAAQSFAHFDDIGRDEQRARSPSVSSATTAGLPTGRSTPR